MSFGHKYQYARTAWEKSFESSSILGHNDGVLATGNDGPGIALAGTATAPFPVAVESQDPMESHNRATLPAA